MEHETYTFLPWVSRKVLKNCLDVTYMFLSGLRGYQVVIKVDKDKLAERVPQHVFKQGLEKWSIGQAKRHL